MPFVAPHCCGDHFLRSIDGDKMAIGKPFADQARRNAMPATYLKDNVIRSDTHLVDDRLQSHSMLSMHWFCPFFFPLKTRIIEVIDQVEIIATVVSPTFDLLDDHRRAWVPPRLPITSERHIVELNVALPIPAGHAECERELHLTRCRSSAGTEKYLKNAFLSRWPNTSKGVQPFKAFHYLFLSQIDCSCQIRNETSLATPPFANRARPSLPGFGKI